jgi:hypothetical protein
MEAIADLLAPYFADSGSEEEFDALKRPNRACRAIAGRVQA